MKYRKRATALWMCLLLTALTGAAFVAQSSKAKTVYNVETKLFSNSPGVTFAELEALSDSVVLGTPTPAAFSELGSAGKVTGVLTGLSVVGTGEKQIVITIVDDSSYLDIARLYVNNQLEVTATVASGGITIRGVNAIASMTGYVLPYSPITVKVEWENLAGETSSDEVTFYF